MGWKELCQLFPQHSRARVIGEHWTAQDMETASLDIILGSLSLSRQHQASIASDRRVLESRLASGQSRREVRHRHNHAAGIRLKVVEPQSRVDGCTKLPRCCRAAGCTHTLRLMRGSGWPRLHITCAVPIPVITVISYRTGAKSPICSEKIPEESSRYFHLVSQEWNWPWQKNTSVGNHVCVAAIDLL